MGLKKFLAKYEDLAKELIRCGSCTNLLLHSGGKYEIIKIGKGKGQGQEEEEEGILCETCIKNKRNIELVTRISEDGNHVFQIPIAQLNLESELKEESKEE